MDAVVPAQVTQELTQILSNLVLGDNEIRSNAENVVNERLAQTPELYLLALAQFTTAADTDVMRSFSLVLLRRLLFRQTINQHQPLPLYDQLSSQTLATIERLLLHALSHEPSSLVRRKAVDTVTDLANGSMERGRPWHALQAQAFSMAQHPDPGLREAAFRVFAGSPNLVMDLQTDSVLAILQKGLQDPQSVEVRHAALRASVAYLTSCDPHQQVHSLALMYPMLNTLPVLPLNHLPSFLSTLTPLASSDPDLFAPHLPALMKFLPQLVLVSSGDPGPTPTVARPHPLGPGTGGGGGGGGGSSFVFPPPGANVDPKGKRVDKNGNGGDTDDADGSGGSSSGGGGGVEQEQEEVRKAALEFMISLSEAKPGTVRRVNGWTGVVVRSCLEGMSEIPEDETEIWLEADPAEDPTDDTYPHVYEQSIDRLACALGGKTVLPPAFQYIPGMLAGHDWRERHAGLMAIAAIAEGTNKVMVNELGKVVELVVPMFADPHPRVRYAACQCIGQLCTDLEEIMQEQFHEQLFSALIPTLEAPEPRVHSHAAAALINFCEGVERDTLIPYLDPIVERLLKLLHPNATLPSSSIPSSPSPSPSPSLSLGSGGGGGGLTTSSNGGGAKPKRYVQEQVVTSLAMVADASEATFAKHYPTIMPLLMNVLQNANSPEYKKLRVKAMECAGLIAIAVGRDVFRPDAPQFVELLMRIQNSPVDPSDTMLGHYLIATWAKVCQAMGVEFEPYLPVVMPPLLAAASAKADVSIYDEDEPTEQKDGWETISMDGRQVGIKTSAIEEKCQAFETLLIYGSTLGPRFAPYLAQSLELVLAGLVFWFHEGVRETSALLIPILLACGKQSGTLTHPMVTASFSQLANCLNRETDVSFVASLYKCVTDSLRVVLFDNPLGGGGGGGSTSGGGGTEGAVPVSSILSTEIQASIMDATKRQLQSLADLRRIRSRSLPSSLSSSSSSTSSTSISTSSTSPISDSSIPSLSTSSSSNSTQQLDPDDDVEREELLLLQEMEDYALEDMAKMVRMMGMGVGLSSVGVGVSVGGGGMGAEEMLIAIGSVRELGVRLDR